MPIPNHKISCFTKVFPTNCPDCGIQVWYFSCTCGSKIFFDHLGFPWPQHICRDREIREQLEFLQDINRMSSDEIYNWLISQEKKFESEISSEINEVIESVIGKRKFTFQTEHIKCTDKIDIIDGKVMEYNSYVNLYKKFGYDESSPFSKGLLNDLGDRKFGEIIIRQSPNEKNISREFHLLVPKGYKIKKGDTILGIVEIAKHSKGKYWILADHKKI